jgi:hypothetical protein
MQWGLHLPIREFVARNKSHNKALDAEPPIASFLKSMLIGGGPVNANVELNGFACGRLVC